MSGALQHTTEITLDQTDESSARIFARQMCTILIHLCEGRALAIVGGAPYHNGPEAWRLFHEWNQPKTRSRELALLNESLGWDFGSKEQFLQRTKDWENATLDNNRTSSAPLQEEVLVAVLISRSPKEVRTYLHVEVREETANLGRVRQLLYDYKRAGKAWKAPCTEDTTETNPSNVVPMDVDALHLDSGSGVSACSADFAPHVQTHTESSVRARSATGQVTKSLGKKTVNFDINGIASSVNMKVLKISKPFLVGRQDGAHRTQDRSG